MGKKNETRVIGVAYVADQLVYCELELVFSPRVSYIL